MGFFGKPEAKITGATSVGITESGKQLVQRQTSQGASFAILARLNERSPSTVKELIDATGMEFFELRERVRILARQGYIRLASSSPVVVD